MKTHFDKQDPYRKENTVRLKWEFEHSFEKFKLSEYRSLSLHLVCTSRCSYSTAVAEEPPGEHTHATHFNTSPCRFPGSVPRPIPGESCHGSKGRPAPAPGRRGGGRERKARLCSAGFVLVCSRCLGPRQCRARSGGRRRVSVSRERPGCAACWDPAGGSAEQERGGECLPGAGGSARACPGAGTLPGGRCRRSMGSGTSAFILPSRGGGRGRGEAKDSGGQRGNGFARKIPRTPPRGKSLRLPGTAAGQGSGQSPRCVTGGQEKSGQPNLGSWRCS